jgi:hypothetical protein
MRSLSSVSDFELTAAKVRILFETTKLFQRNLQHWGIFVTFALENNPPS